MASRPTLTLDVSRYENYLADSGLSEADKRALLESLWTIIVAFVERGFGVHPVQQVLDAQESGPDVTAGGRAGEDSRARDRLTRHARNITNNKTNQKEKRSPHDRRKGDTRTLHKTP